MDMGPSFYQQPEQVIEELDSLDIAPPFRARLRDGGLTSLSDLAYAEVRAVSDVLNSNVTLTRVIRTARNQLRLGCPECNGLELIYSEDGSHAGSGLPPEVECYYCDWAGPRSEIRAQQIANYVTEVDRVGPATADQLADAFGSIWNIVEADPEQLAEETRLGREKAIEVHAHVSKHIHPESDPRSTQTTDSDDSAPLPTMVAHSLETDELEPIIQAILDHTELDRDSAEWFVTASHVFREACPKHILTEARDAGERLETVTAEIERLEDERQAMWNTGWEEVDGESVWQNEFVGDEQRRDEIRNKKDELGSVARRHRERLWTAVEDFLESDKLVFDSYKEAIVGSRAIFDRIWSEPMRGVDLADRVGCSKGYASQFELVGFETGSVVLEKDYVRKRDPLSASDRQEILDRDDRQCVRCGGGSRGSFAVHHIIPVSDGGATEAENLATLCTDCHYDAHGGVMLSNDVVYEGQDEFWEWAESS